MRDNDTQNNANHQDSTQSQHFAIEQIVFVVLMIMSLLGMVIMRFSQQDGYAYWLFMVLVFSILSIFVSKLQSKIKDIDFNAIVKEQGLHWLHTLIIVGISSLLHKSGQLSDMGASLVILLILALATMLDGMRIGWQFSVLGFFLAASTVIIAYVELFIWACAGLAIVVIIGTYFWELRQYKIQSVIVGSNQR